MARLKPRPAAVTGARRGVGGLGYPAARARARARARVRDPARGQGRRRPVSPRELGEGVQEAYAKISDDDRTLEAALREAHIPSLMNALVHLTGDVSLLRGDIRPQAGLLADPQAGITEEQQAWVRARALEVLRSFRDDGRRLPPPPSREVVREMLDFMVGQPVSPEYVQFLISELALEGEDPYAQPAIHAIPEHVRSSFRVLVIGAGMSGLLAGIRLKEAGIPFVIVEKNSDVGGTWHENTYPGCRVDSPNHVYSYSFRPHDWPQHFSAQPVLREYFERCASDYGLREHIRFDTEVTSARFDEQSGRWRAELQLADGGSDSIEANAIISAVGQLNRPRLPDIPGREAFEGPSFHSARWEHEHDLRGKRIGVIGTGASAFQFVPVIAPDAAEVTIFQRTPPWVVPNPDYFKEVPEGKHWLLRHVPYYDKWYRFSVFWRTAEGLLGACRHDPAWKETERAVSAENDMVRALLTANITAIVGDDPDLLEKTIPDYPFGSKRALIDDGTWLRTLKRENVHLLAQPIERITPRGVLTKDGAEHEFDVIVYGTGFYASRFLYPMKIFGRGGAELHDVWAGEPHAYLGVTIPGFPNLFCCYGPNTNIVVNGSIIFFSECVVRYILGCLALLLERGHAAMDCKQAVHDAYNERIDAGNAQMAWGMSRVNSWYKNDSGRVTQNWPFSLLEFWQQTQEPDPADYSFL
jgi:4-hydroxyacetophenone monooxygenase